MAEPLWTPSAERIEAARITRFLKRVSEAHGLDLRDYDALWRWSVDHPALFWEAMWQEAGIVHSEPYTEVLANPEMPGATWFPGAKLNFAENLLRFRDDRDAIVFVHEGGDKIERITYAELYDRTSRMVQFLTDQGLYEGDRVAAFLPNRPEAVITMLAATAMGATFTSCSPDFGHRGILDRFGQVEPTILIGCDGYFYNGKRYFTLERLQQVLLDIYTVERTVVVPVITENPSRAGLRGALMWNEALERPGTDIDFKQVPFDHPAAILYSSGTTGTPKCIQHGVGGMLLQHAKELMLHTDVGRDDVLFFHTTTGWMMWNWLVSGLATGCTIVLYDGSPSHPDLHTLWKVADKTGITVFGTSPKFLRACANAGLKPGEEHDLSKLRTVLSTGAPLAPELFEWTYANVKRDLQLSSISGGTDIVSCFMLGSPIDPVYPGEIQKRGLGMAVQAYNEEGEPVVGEKGELVCEKPFPSIPIGFWDDPTGERFRSAYFDRWPGVWRHGDWIEITERGGVIVYGRSDATLNPGGVRIGTAEIYRVVEEMDEVEDAIVVGQEWQGDTRVVLFVVLRDGLTLADPLRKKIRARIKEQATPRHVPAKIVQVADVPRTLSGKKVELAVTRILHGEPVDNRDALANPDALDLFEDLEELED